MKNNIFDTELRFLSPDIDFKKLIKGYVMVNIADMNVLDNTKYIHYFTIKGKLLFTYNVTSTGWKTIYINYPYLESVLSEWMKLGEQYVIDNLIKDHFAYDYNYIKFRPCYNDDIKILETNFKPSE